MFSSFKHLQQRDQRHCSHLKFIVEPSRAKGISSSVLPTALQFTYSIEALDDEKQCSLSTTAVVELVRNQKANRRTRSKRSKRQRSAEVRSNVSISNFPEV